MAAHAPPQDVDVTEYMFTILTEELLDNTCLTSLSLANNRFTTVLSNSLGYMLTYAALHRTQTHSRVDHSYNHSHSHSHICSHR